MGFKPWLFPFQTRTWLSQSVVMWMRPKPCPNLQKTPRVQTLLYMPVVTHTACAHKHLALWCSSFFSHTLCRLIFQDVIFARDAPPTKTHKIMCSGFIQMMRVIQMQRRSKRKRWVSGLALLPTHTHTHTLSHTPTPSGQWVQRFLNISVSATDTQTVPEALAVTQCGLRGWGTAAIDCFLRRDECQLGVSGKFFTKNG